MKPTFYSKTEYFADLRRRLDEAGEGDRISTVTMAFQPARPEIGDIVKRLAAAAGRGAKVTLAGDAFPILGPRPVVPGPLFFYPRVPSRLPRVGGKFLRAFEAIRHAGGEAGLINVPSRPFTNPYGGRSHIKFTAINDRVYIGGCNLDRVDIDVMVGWEDAATAGFLHDLAKRLLDSGNALKALAGKDSVRAVGPDSTLLLDAGVKGRSLIYQEALGLIDEAREHLYLTCQYFPTGEISQHLVAAGGRGVKVTIVFNHPSRHKWPFNMLFLGVVTRESRRLPSGFVLQPVRPPHGYLHAKVLASERAAIVGSHNFVEAGINFGTAEIALLVKDGGFSDRLVQTVAHQL